MNPPRPRPGAARGCSLPMDEPAQPRTDTRLHSLTAHLGGIKKERDEKEAGGAECSKNQQQERREIKIHPRSSSGCSGRCFPTSGALHGWLSSSRVGAGVTSAPHSSGVQLWLFTFPDLFSGICLQHPGSLYLWEIQSFLGKTSPVPVVITCIPVTSWGGEGPGDGRYPALH